MKLDKSIIWTLIHDYFNTGIQLPEHGTWNKAELRPSDIDDLLHFYNNSFRRGLIEYPEKSPHPTPYSTNKFDLIFFITKYLNVLCQRRNTIKQLKVLFDSFSLLGIEFPSYDSKHNRFYYSINGKSFNHNLRKYSEFILILRQHLSLKEINVCEIGAGYGGLAELLLLNGKIKNYFIIDLFETIAVSMTYLQHQLKEQYNLFYLQSAAELRKLEGKNNIVFIPVQRYKEIKETLPGLFDVNLFINASSFVEMPTATIVDYFSFIESWERTYLFSYNKVNRIEGNKQITAYSFPYDNRWKDVYIKEDDRYGELARLSYRGNWK